MNDHGPTPPKQPSIDPALIVAFALCVMFVGGLYFVMIAPSGSRETAGEDSGPEQSYRFTAMTIDAGRLARARDQRQGEARLEKAPQEIARLQELVREANLMQFPSDPPLTPEAVTKIEREIMYAANEVIPATGFPGFVTAGESMFEACLQGLDELLLAVRRGNVDMPDSIRRSRASKLIAKTVATPSKSSSSMGSSPPRDAGARPMGQRSSSCSCAFDGPT